MVTKSLSATDAEVPLSPVNLHDVIVPAPPLAAAVILPWASIVISAEVYAPAVTAVLSNWTSSVLAATVLVLIPVPPSIFAFSPLIIASGVPVSPSKFQLVIPAPVTHGTLTTSWPPSLNWTPYVLAVVALTAVLATDCTVSLNNLPNPNTVDVTASSSSC